MVDYTPERLHALTTALLEEISVSNHPDPRETPNWWLLLRLIEQLGCQYSEAVQLLPHFKANYWSHRGTAPDNEPYGSSSREKAEPINNGTHTLPTPEAAKQKPAEDFPGLQFLREHKSILFLTAFNEESTLFKIWLDSQVRRLEELRDTDVLTLPETQQKRHIKQIKAIEAMLSRCLAFVSVAEHTVHITSTEAIDKCAEGLSNWAERKQLRHENAHLRFQVRLLRNMLGHKSPSTSKPLTNDYK